MKRRRNVQAGGSCVGRRRERPTHSNTTAGRAAVGVAHRLSCRPEAAGSLPELGVGEWMRLMLLCCTWKDERMGEEEGKEPLGVKSRWLHAAAAGREMQGQRRVLSCSKHRGCSPETGCKRYALHYISYLYCQSHTDNSVALLYLQGAPGCMGILCCSWSHVFSASWCTRHVWMQWSPSGHARCSSASCLLPKLNIFCLWARCYVNKLNDVGIHAKGAAWSYGLAQHNLKLLQSWTEMKNILEAFPWCGAAYLIVQWLKSPPVFFICFLVCDWYWFNNDSRW